MGSTASFRGSNYGSQIGVNYGSVTNEFHVPWDLDDKLSPVSGAAFDSYVNQHEDHCLPGTRTDLLSQISEWASSPQGRCIFWLNGIAGTGKSTISRTMAKSFSLYQSLGASFFFKRGEGDRGNAKKLFPTIARQLAINIPEIAPVLQEIVRQNPGITTKIIREQFEKLLLQPLHSLERSKIPTQAMVIVIDALDECDGDGDIRLILQLLPQLQNLAAARLRVLLTSRPDLPIRMGFSKIADDDHRDFVLHDIPLEMIKHDIALFFDHRLTEIRSERFLPSDWPGDEDLQKLVALSIPLFIFAATICRIFQEPDWDPIDSLTEILARQNDQSKLDRVYLPVLHRLLGRQHEKHKEKLVSEFQQIIGAIVTLESPLSVPSLAKLLDLPERLVRLRLDPLYSVLKVPDNETAPVRLFHLSFRDFLLDPETRNRTPFGINETDMHYMLAKQCLLMCQSLRKNICGLPSDGIERTEIARHTVEIYIPPELQYACRYWADHLVRCANSGNMIYGALLFLQRHFLRKHFLHWVEAMSLTGLMSETLGILDRLQAAIAGNGSSSTSDFLYDAKQFILKNYRIVDQAPLQVYCAGLVFTPQTARIRVQFKQEIPTWLCQLPRVEESWGPELQTLEGHSSRVQSVVFSRDGRLLASGAHDNTVQVWEPATGALTQTLKGHLGPVTSVAFSADGRLLASGSEDKTVRLWNPLTGALIRTLEGNLKWVLSVTFSLGSRLLASGCLDKTVRLWDPETGAIILTLHGHIGAVASVAFSSDGQLLASGSEDKTVRLWDPLTGALLQTLEGHPTGVWSVCFSPDDRLLASSSSDNTIRLWNMATGVLVRRIDSYSNQVLSVTFSSDSRLLASGSSDNTVRLWDSATGALTQILTGHSYCVHSVAFSPDGRLLASGSGDNTVRLWDPTAGAQKEPMKGHSKLIEWVVFSPSGRLLASSSGDNIIGIWDPMTGALTDTLEGALSYASSGAFSPDERLFAAGTNDGKVQLWDLITGTLSQQFKGHLSAISLVAFSTDGRLLASSSGVQPYDMATDVFTQADNTVRVWDVATGTLTRTLEGHLESVASVAFSPDSQLMASGSKDNTMRLWDVATGALARTWNVEQVVTTLEFSCGGSRLRTNIGWVDIESECDVSSFHPPCANLGISIGNDHWIRLSGEKVLWLPTESRPTCFKVNGNTLALGHASGRISFIKFVI